VEAIGQETDRLGPDWSQSIGHEMTVDIGILGAQRERKANFARCKEVGDISAKNTLGQVEVQLLGQAQADELVHIRRCVLLVHRTNPAININNHVVLDNQICPLVSLRIVGLLHTTLIFELSTQCQSTSASGIEHGQCIANGRELSGEGRILEQREGS
jgi:hypothetical protein